jgi:hypothetical protein
MPEPTIWERVDLPVLRWVASCEYSVGWQFDRGAPTEEVPDLTGDELDAALRWLEGYGLITATQRNETSGYFVWVRLRPTADGWRVLGEWPPASEADMGAALTWMLEALDAVLSCEAEGGYRQSGRGRLIHCRAILEFRAVRRHSRFAVRTTKDPVPFGCLPFSMLIKYPDN